LLPFLGLNRNNSKNVQSLINNELLWCIDSDSSNKEDYLSIEKKKKCKSYFKRNSTVSVYTLSRDFLVFPIAGFCASLQITCFCKWRNSKCLIKDLINYILPCHVIFGRKNHWCSTRKLRKRISLNSKMLLNHIGLMLVNFKELKVRITITSNL